MSTAQAIDLETEIPSKIQLEEIGCTATVLKLAEGEDDDEKKPRKLSIKLHTGQPIQRYGTQIIFQLSGMSVPNRQMPVLFAHDPTRPIGFSTARPGVEAGAGVVVEAQLLENQDANFVASQADQGLQWQASMGANVDQIRRLEDKETLKVNGIQMEGPALVVTEWTLVEASVLTLGADGETKSKILSLNSPAGSAAMADPTPAPVAQPNDTRAELATMRQAFPGREDWATQQFLAGHDVTQAKANLADVLLAEAEAANATNADLAARLELVAQAGHPGTPVTPAPEPAPAAVELDLTGISGLAEWGVAQLNELLAPEWAALSPADRIEFKDVTTYSAYRRAMALGNVRVTGF